MWSHYALQRLHTKKNKAQSAIQKKQEHNKGKNVIIWKMKCRRVFHFEIDLLRHHGHAFTWWGIMRICFGTDCFGCCPEDWGSGNSPLHSCPIVDICRLCKPRHAKRPSTTEKDIIVHRWKAWCGWEKGRFKITSVAYSSKRSHTGQLNFSNWLADGSTTGCDLYYAPPSLSMSTFLIRSTTSQSSSYPVVLTG